MQGFSGLNLFMLIAPGMLLMIPLLYL